MVAFEVISYTDFRALSKEEKVVLLGDYLNLLKENELGLNSLAGAWNIKEGTLLNWLSRLGINKKKNNPKTRRRKKEEKVSESRKEEELTTKTSKEKDEEYHKNKVGFVLTIQGRMNLQDLIKVSSLFAETFKPSDFKIEMKIEEGEEKGR